MEKQTQVVLCWHMHQPYYRDGLDGNYRLPWVYLHAIKDYTDMAAHLEAFAAARVVVNFAPVLLEQLDDYATQLRSWLKDGLPMRDPLLNLVAGETPIPDDPEGRAEIIRACQRLHAPTMVDPYPQFRALVDIARQQYSDGELDSARIRYLSAQFFVDLLMWYHLAWLGSSVKESDARVKRLLGRKNIFTRVDQLLLMEVLAELLAGIIPRYRALADSGRIELSMTPYGHPILPLLIDFTVMHATDPTAEIASLGDNYPGGVERAQWHVRRGIEVFEHYFGRRPRGVWLAEGGVSSAVLKVLDEFDIAWTASGEGVWRGSCEDSGLDAAALEHKRALYQPMRHPPSDCALFFRDDGLSDLIGFQYKDWDADAAAGHFCQQLDNIAAFFPDDENVVVTVILDGENAWEYYPANGSFFLQRLYQQLSSQPQLRLTTFSAVLEQRQSPLPQLPRLRPGSWVYGSFSTWIGSRDKNAAWNLLVEAKRCYDRVVRSGLLSDEQIAAATAQLAICEGSDWFWWFGDYNPAASVRDFDQLYRRHLVRLYQLLDKVPPAALYCPLSHGSGDDSAENSGTMRRN